MKKLIFATIALASLYVSAQSKLWMDTSLSFHERTKLLVDQLTLDEKIYKK